MFTECNINRGFKLLRFKDRYNEDCNIQKSSLATEDCIWLGVENPNPQIMASKTPQGGTGWVKYDIPDNVLIASRMHLNRKQARELAKVLNKFARTGELNL